MERGSLQTMKTIFLASGEWLFRGLRDKKKGESPLFSTPRDNQVEKTLSDGHELQLLSGSKNSLKVRKPIS